MISTLITMILGTVVPQLATGVKSFLNLKQDRLDKEHELALARLQIEAQREKINIDREVSFAKAEAQEAESYASVIKSANEANTERAKIKSGIAWVDSLDQITRFVFALIAGFVILVSVRQAINLDSLVWQAEPLWRLIEMIVGYYVAYGTSAYSQKKVNKRK